MGCWCERDGSQRAPGRAADVRRYRKRRVDRVETTPRAAFDAFSRIYKRARVTLLNERADPGKDLEWMEKTLRSKGLLEPTAPPLETA